jgi:hypothetical protein
VTTGSLYCSFGKAEQGSEGKAGRIGDCAEDQDKGKQCTSRGKNNNLKVGQQADSWKVQVITAAATDRWDGAALRREKLADNDIGQILLEVEAGQCLEWKEIADHIPIYKSHWAQ